MKIKNLFQRKDRLDKAKAGSENGGAVRDALYELWSRDTFEGRTFLCDVYDNYEEAEAALRQCRERALTQDEKLRDTYWLVGTDAAGVAERERKESERIDACRREKHYAPDHLQAVCERAADKFSDFLKENEAHPILDRSVDTVWHHPDDCFDRIGLKLGKSCPHGVFFVSLWVWIRSSEHYQGGGDATFVLDGRTIKELRSRLRNLDVRNNFFHTAERLIKEHFEGDRP